MVSKLVQAFNLELVERNVQLDIRAYLKRINNDVFKQPIDEFVDDLLDLVICDNFSISHEKLVKYGVLTCSSNMGAHVSRLLTQYGFEEGRDYSPPTEINTGGRGRPAKAYFLHPDTFEHCLMRARNTDKYAKFYSLLRKCVALYDKYQIALKEHKIMSLTEQNVELMRIMAEMRAENKQTNTCVNGIQVELKETRAELKVVNTKVDVLQGGITEVISQLDTVSAVANSEFAKQEAAADAHIEAAAGIAIPPEKSSDADSLLLMWLSPKKYMACRIQAKTVNKTIRKHIGKYPLIREVIHLTDIPNGKYLWNNCKAALKGRIKMTGASPTIFTLEGDTTEQEVIDKLNQLYDRPVERARLAGAATKNRVAVGRTKVQTASTVASHIMTRVTTTVTETIKLADDELDALLDEFLN